MFPKFILLILLTIYLNSATGFSQEKGRFVTELEQGQPQTIVAYGTSLTANGAWVSQLKDVLDKRFPGKATIINSGQVAMHSNWGVANIGPRVLQKHPDTLFIEFSINDAFLDYKISPETARKNLESMIDQTLVENPKCEIILAVMNPPIDEHLAKRPDILVYNQLYRDVARERKLRLVDYYPAWQKVLDQGEEKYRVLVPDGIHPSPAGCEAVTTPTLLKNIGLQANQ